MSMLVEEGFFMLIICALLGDAVNEAALIWSSGMPRASGGVYLLG